MIAKCGNCIKKYHDLYGACPYYAKISDAFIHINNSFSCIRTGHANQQIPKEWLTFDFSCKFYSPKPTTEEAFL